MSCGPPKDEKKKENGKRKKKRNVKCLSFICQNDSDLQEGGDIRYRTFKISIGQVNGLANKGGTTLKYRTFAKMKKTFHIEISQMFGKNYFLTYQDEIQFNVAEEPVLRGQSRSGSLPPPLQASQLKMSEKLPKFSLMRQKNPVLRGQSRFGSLTPPP